MLLPLAFVTLVVLGTAILLAAILLSRQPRPWWAPLAYALFAFIAVLAASVGVGYLLTTLAGWDYGIPFGFLIGAVLALAAGIVTLASTWPRAQNTPVR